MSSFGSMMMHTTGSHKFNIVLRMIAKKSNILINQYGIFDIYTKKKLGGETELSIFKNIKTKNHPNRKVWVHPIDRDI
jgi:DNA polymerase/3'-5' exonuclease PolX